MPKLSFDDILFRRASFRGKGTVVNIHIPKAAGISVATNAEADAFLSRTGLTPFIFQVIFDLTISILATLQRAVHNIDSGAPSIRSLTFYLQPFGARTRSTLSPSAGS